MKSADRKLIETVTKKVDPKFTRRAKQWASLLLRSLHEGDMVTDAEKILENDLSLLIGLANEYPDNQNLIKVVESVLFEHHKNGQPSPSYKELENEARTKLGKMISDMRDQISNTMIEGGSSHLEGRRSTTAPENVRKTVARERSIR